MKEKDTEKQLKALEEAVRQEQETGGKTAKKHRESSSAAAKESHPLASFLIGLVLLGAGIFWVLNSFVVSFSWGSLWGGDSSSSSGSSSSTETGTEQGTAGSGDPSQKPLTDWWSSLLG